MLKIVSFFILKWNWSKSRYFFSFENVLLFKKLKGFMKVFIQKFFLLKVKVVQKINIFVYQDLKKKLKLNFSIIRVDPSGRTERIALNVNLGILPNRYSFTYITLQWGDWRWSHDVTRLQRGTTLPPLILIGGQGQRQRGWASHFFTARHVVTDLKHFQVYVIFWHKSYFIKKRIQN